MKYYIPQIDYSDCGFACLKMMVASLYQDQNALFIKQDESHGPYSLLDLKKLAETYGIILDGVEVDDKLLIKEIRLPFIALLQKKNEVCHYVLVHKIKHGYVNYLDPEIGECSLSIKNFSHLWTGTALIISEFNKREIEFKNYEVDDKKKDFFTPLLQVFSSILLAVGIFFIDDKSTIYLPLVFLSSSVISEIILRIFLIKKMEKMDIQLINQAVVKKGKYHEFYLRYEEYKKSHVSHKLTLVFSLLSILFITTIVLLNNIYNAFIVLIPLFIAIMDVKFISPMINEKEELIALEERELGHIKNIDLLKKQIDKIHLRGYKVAKTMLLKKYIYLALLLLTSLLTTVFNETFSLPYVIFYFAISYTLLEQDIAFMSYPMKRIMDLRNKSRLINLME